MASATSNNPASSSMSPRRISGNHGSPTASVAQSPRRPSRQVSSPWTQIVRGESEPIAAAAAVAGPSSPQSRAPIEPIASVSVAAPTAAVLTVEAAAGDEKSEASGGQDNAGKKPVWKRPSNGASEVGPVMGASSWPALSETTKAPSNKSSSDSLKSLGDVPSSSSASSSVPVTQGIANASVPAPKQAGRANPNPTPNHSRQRSFKQRNGASGSANGTVSQPSAQGSFTELPSHNPSPRGQNQKNGFASQNHGGTENPSQRDSYRNQNGNHHQSHGGRRNQEHGNQNWTFQRSFNGREGNAQSQRGTPAFVRHPSPTVQPIPQFMAAQPFPSHIPFPTELAQSSYYPRMPYMTPIPHGPQFFYHYQDPPLHMKLHKQIQYYFSDENLITDIYLRGFMNNEGFVPLRVVAGFKKVAELTDNIQQIVEALQNSPHVEVQGDFIRKRDNWQNWVLRRNPTGSGPQSVDRADAVAKRLGNLSVDQSSADPIGGSSSQLQPTEALSDDQQQSSSTAPVSNHNAPDGANR
ncbi:unnamed protein product [Arabidopsis thaliana]|uniref:La-related protein 1C n=2 Tax=Arabidopsis thaliana TaxID=3702 RepID=LRP1C_ARATH|nr:winged-helix DNA-binding transcription factor family protein [Arabidopsis thaliana]Q94K80.1 RecName: Full=La-related protein 1C; Short=AtLARP1c [Arabidopsis thaliana]AAK44022.1 unknown protein [Arabidopsis thaliana]AAM91803.1 unknown protein [Arabidopsis thaliana]AEE86585.1 winged-helix DNA-binding transcription factor family protein [Arabidopsis thaliana]CAA0397632.1 unnamed protein product [Arabidopsis thaliana]CAD5330074.1 unnamed protein product [Arabidopsis thaliana]|eukprot:NP_567991.1 winged-helix DNA-binding transcription factor family protein [Arabidopsis thaliana]